MAKAKNLDGGGRPTSLTEASKQKFIEAIKIGQTYARACLRAGIVFNTFKNWLKYAENGDEYFLTFLNELKAAEAEGEYSRLQRIDKAGDDAWQALAWIQERRNPAEWGRIDRIAVMGDLEGITPAVIVLPPRDIPDYGDKFGDVGSDNGNLLTDGNGEK